MNEFAAKAAAQAAPAVPPHSSQNAGPGLWQRPIVAGLSLPWLIGVVVLLGSAAWYLFAPDSVPSVNQLAFQEDFEQQPLDSEPPAPIPSAFPVTSTGDGQLKNEVAAMVGGVRNYAQANRTAIERLSESFRSQSVELTALKQQMAELQAQHALLTARQSSAPTAPVKAVAARKSAKPASRPRSSLAGMHLAAVQTGMAWVYYKDKTWAVKVGDPVGPVTITGIDAPARVVHTSAGTLK